MTVPVWGWLLTLGLTVVVLAVDVAVIARRPHRPSIRELATALTVYVGAAVAFGIGMWWWAGAQPAGEFVAGWLTEYSLSVDNLFVFILIMARFAVPEQLQQYALIVGIVIAIVLRGVFIALGAAAIAQRHLGLLRLRRRSSSTPRSRSSGRGRATTTSTRRTGSCASSSAGSRRPSRMPGRGC